MIPDAPGALTAAFKVGLEPLEMLGLKRRHDGHFLAADSADRIGQRAPLRELGVSLRNHGAHRVRRFGAQRQFLATSARPVGRLAPGASGRLGRHDSRRSSTSCNRRSTRPDTPSTDISFSPHTVKSQYDAPTTRNDPIVSPRVAFDQLFTGFTLPTEGQPPPPPDPELLRRKDLLGRIEKAYARLQPKLGSGDLGSASTNTSRTCGLSSSAHRLIPDTTNDAEDVRLRDPRAVRRRSAGVERVRQRRSPRREFRRSDPHGLCMRSFARGFSRAHLEHVRDRASHLSRHHLPQLGQLASATAAVARSDPRQRGNNLSVAECIRWHVKQLAALAKKLKDTPDVSGNMLDNTVIVFQMEAGFGDTSLQGASLVGEPPPHTSEGMMALVIGGKSLGMQLGTHLVATGQHPASVSLTAMRAVGGSPFSALGEIKEEITGLRM